MEPTVEQVRILEELRHGRRSNTDLAEEIDFDDPATLAAFRDAIASGWIWPSVAGIGGLRGRPESYYELTDSGRALLKP